jgi:hypothetical protein
MRGATMALQHRTMACVALPWPFNTALWHARNTGAAQRALGGTAGGQPCLMQPAAALRA